MNQKQVTILNNILEIFELPKPKTFVQHRNLNEFKYFKIERINPNHRIHLYGILKNNNKKKETTKALIKVGELLFISGCLLSNFQIIYENSNLIMLIFSMFFMNCFIFYLFGNINILKVIK
jgi:hypothetical protein